MQWRPSKTFFLLLRVRLSAVRAVHFVCGSAVAWVLVQTCPIHTVAHAGPYPEPGLAGRMWWHHMAGCCVPCWWAGTAHVWTARRQSTQPTPFLMGLSGSGFHGNGWLLTAVWWWKEKEGSQPIESNKSDRSQWSELAASLPFDVQFIQKQPWC